VNRREGLFVPMAEVEAHIACGWTIIDDLLVPDPLGAVRLCGCGDVVLMAPPACHAASAERRAA
jgi:hypothetical protein